MQIPINKRIDCYRLSAMNNKYYMLLVPKKSNIPIKPKYPELLVVPSTLSTCAGYTTQKKVTEEKANIES